MSLEVAKASEIPPGTMKIVEPEEGTRVAICNVEGTFYAIEDKCTHDDGPLGTGSLDGAEVECPRHGARFDVASGRATRMPAIVPVKTFPVREEGGSVFLDL